jgi:hypothetical protein
MPWDNSAPLATFAMVVSESPRLAIEAMVDSISCCRRSSRVAVLSPPLDLGLFRAIWPSVFLNFFIN